MGNRRGSVLIAVLWSLFFLAMLAVAISAYVRPQLEFAGRLLGKAKMHYIARAGVERAIIEVESDETKEYDSLYDSWSTNDAVFSNVPFGGGAFSVVKAGPSGESKTQYGLTDEESKININRASHDVLKNLLEKEAGVEPKEADVIADSILDWIDEDDSLHKDGREDDYYQLLLEPYPCKNGALESIEELLLVAGMTREIFDKVKDIITIYGDGIVNVNTASVRVLEALGLSKEAAEGIVSFRTGQSSKKEGEVPDNVFTDASTIVNILKEADVKDEDGSLTRAAAMLGVKSYNFRGTVKGSLARAGRSETITFVYGRNEKIIKYWREE